LTPKEKSDVIKYIELKQMMAALMEERAMLELCYEAELAARERRLEELQDQQRLRGKLWLPWPMYIR
jgi:hypothetical protein